MLRSKNLTSSKAAFVETCSFLTCAVQTVDGAVQTRQSLHFEAYRPPPVKAAVALYGPLLARPTKHSCCCSSLIVLLTTP